MEKNEIEKKYIKISVKKLAIYIIALIIIILLGIITIKSIVFNSIANKMEVYMNSTNYYMRFYFYQGWNVSTTEIWVKDNNMICKENDEITTIVQDGKQYDIIENNIVNSDNTELMLDNNWLYIKTLQDNLLNPINVIKYSLESVKVNGKNCYRIEDNDTILYFEKDTGLIVRIEFLEGFSTPSENEVQSTILDYKFIFNNVKDEDVQIDLSKYNLT